MISKLGHDTAGAVLQIRLLESPLHREKDGAAIRRPEYRPRCFGTGHSVHVRRGQVAYPDIRAISTCGSESQPPAVGRDGRGLAARGRRKNVSLGRGVFDLYTLPGLL